MGHMLDKDLENSTILLDFKVPVVVETLHQVSEWRGFTLEHSALPLSAAYEFKNAQPHHHYLAYHDLVLKKGEMEIAGYKDEQGLVKIKGGDLRGRLTYIPGEREFNGWAVPEERGNSFTTLRFRPEMLGEELEMAFIGREPQPKVYFTDENLKTSMLKLEQLLKSGHPHSSLYLESLGLALVLDLNETLVRAHSATLKRGGLSRRNREMLQSYIREHIAKDMTLDELATLVEMSRFHFSRAFKVSFGVSPVRYVNRERYRLAQTLLRDTRLPVTQIALQVGFGSVQRFLKVFKDFCGVSPGEYRRGV